MHFTIVYDAARQGWVAFWFVLPGLIFVYAGWRMVHQPGKVRTLTFNGRTVAGMSAEFAKVFYWFAVLWSVTCFASIAIQYAGAVMSLESGTAPIAEGPVTNFVPMPYLGHAKESFEVAGHHFSYSSYVNTVGFNHTSSHGGPVHESLDVRITYSGDTILRLEIAQ
jgi:hypothetical protein